MSEPKPWEQSTIDRDMDRARRAEPKLIRQIVATVQHLQPNKGPPINVRTKGADGERQVAKVLNEIVNRLLAVYGIPVPERPVIQRNQNQTAVGGNDLSNTFGLGIEIKRQEQLSINTWWKQCTDAALRNNEFPVLIYRQNKGAWRVVMHTWAQLPAGTGATAVQVRSEMSWETFQEWFRLWVDRKLSNGELPQV